MAADFLMTCLGVIPTVQLIAATFQCSVDASTPLSFTSGGLLPYMLLFSLLWSLFWSCLRRWYLTLPVLAGLMFFTLRHNTEMLIRGANTFMTDLCWSYTRVFDSLNLYYPHADNSDCTIFFIVVTFILAFLVSMAVTIHRGKALYSILATAPFFAMCIVVNSFPSIPCVMALMLFWGVSLATGRFSGPGNPLSARAAAVVLLPVAAFLTVLLIKVSPNDYEYTDAMQQQAQNLDAAFQRALGRLTGKPYETPAPTQAPAPTYEPLHTRPGSTTPPNTPAAATSVVVPGADTSGFWTAIDQEMDVAGRGALHQTGGELLSVVSTLSGRVYLRSFAYGDYTGSGWAEPDYENGSVADAYAYKAVSGLSGVRRGSMTVTRTGDLSAYLPMPYYSSGDVEFLDVDLFSSFLGRKYSAGYIQYTGDFTDAALTGADAAAERNNRSTVYMLYTGLPESTKAAMLDIARENGLSADSPGIIGDVAGFVKNSGVYDLNISPVPDGEDCAVYFLTQSHRGYCIHFATAAAVMYRALGIPARMVSGFMFTTQTNETVSVTDKDAHAWVEVYIDGVGWIPVEVTGSTTASREDAGVQGRLDQVPVQPPVGIASMEAETAVNLRPLLRFIPAALILAALVCAVLFWRRLAALIRAKRFGCGDNNAAVVRIWKYASRVSRFGAAIPEDIQAIAGRACYSRLGAAREERIQAQSSAEAFAQKVYSGLKPVKRFVFKYIFGLI